MQNKQEKVPTYPIGSVNNALRLLLMFRDHPLIRVSEAGVALGVAASTAHRLLAMLEYHGFVQQDEETRGYRSGPALVEIGLTAVRSIDVRSHLLPYMERLCDEVDETVQLMVLEGPDCLFLEAVESRQVVRTSSRVGLRLPAYTVSGGKALLAELAPARLRELYPTSRLEVRTPRSVRTRTALEAALARPVPAEDTSAYCQARARLPLELLQELIRRVGGSLQQRVPELAEALKRTAGEAAAGLA